MCYNGGPIKYFEQNKQPCHLDTAKQVLDNLRKGDFLSKVDDKSGFHQLVLDNFSKEKAYCSYAGEFFRFNAAAFELPKVPGIYQTINSVAVNILRDLGHSVFLYLDD